MKKAFILLPILGLVIGCSDPVGTIDNSGQNNNTGSLKYVVSIPTAEEEANTLLNQISRRNNSVRYPNTQLINDARNKVNGGGTLTSAEETALKRHFINDVYNPQDYQASYGTVNGVLATAKNQGSVFEYYKKAWGFFIPEKYTITISLYQTNGMYRPYTGEIILPITKENNHWGNTRPPALSSILHESIHIGIEEIIIQRYQVPSVMKEYIVDQFMEHHFKNICPNYWKGTQETPPISKIFQADDVFDNLPTRVRDFMKNN
jgi:hypothetical protein